MTIKPIKKFFRDLSIPSRLACQELPKKLEKKEWGYVRDTESSLGARMAACVFVLLDKASHVVFQIGMAVEAAVKAAFALYTHINREPLKSDDERYSRSSDKKYKNIAKEMAIRCPLAALACIVHISSLVVSVPYGLARAVWDPKSYAASQI